MADKLAVIQSDETVKELNLIDDRLKGLIVTFKDLVDIGGKVNSGLLKGTPKEFIESEKQMIALQKEKAKVLKDLAITDQQIEKARLATANANKAEIDVQKKKIQLTQQEEKQINKTLTAYKRFSAEVLAAKNKAKDLGAEMVFLEQKFKKGDLTKRQYTTQLNKLSKEFVDAKVKASGLDVQIKKLDKSVGDNQRNVGNYKSALGGLNNSFKTLLASFGVVGGITLFAGLIKSSYETIKVLDAQNNALKQIFETEAQVAFQKEYLSEVTQKYGLDIISATEGYTKYAAALRGTNIEGEKGRVIFSAFSGASAKLGLNAEQQKGIFKALEQMISKGTVQAEELRGQLGDRLPGAFKLFADAAGVSTKELGEMLKKGEVLASDILPKVAAQLNETYNLGTGEKIDTLAAAQNRLKNSWTSFLDQTAGNKELVNGLAVGMEALGDVVNFVLDTLIVKGSDGVSVLGDVIDIMKSLLNAVGDMAEGLGFMDKKTKNTLFSLNAFKNDLKSIQSVISVVTGLIKSLTEQISAFFGTFFKTDGWDKFLKSVDEADKKYQNVYNNYLKVQKGVKEANAKGTVYNNEADPYITAWQKATKEKQAFFQLNGKYFDSKSGRNTGKSLDDYIDRNGKLVKKDKAPQDFGKDDSVKTKKGRVGSQVSRAERDAIDSAIADRDNQIAKIKEQKLKLQITEKEYWESYIKIQINYRAKILKILNDDNGRKRRISASVRLKAITEIEKANKEIYDYEKRGLDAQRKLQEQNLENRLEFIKNDEYILEQERIKQQNDVYNELITDTDKYYFDLIEKAKKYGQEIINIEAERDTKIASIQKSQMGVNSGSSDANIKDTKYYQDLEDAYKSAADAEERTLILANSKLTIKEREYFLALKEGEQTLDNLKKEKERLLTREAELRLKDKTNKLTVDESSELSEIVEKYSLINEKLALTAEQIKQIKLDKFKEDWSTTIDFISKGLTDLGFGNFADAFQDKFAKIIQDLKDGTLDWKDVALLAASAVADALTNLNQKTYEQRIAQLDEELKRTQQVTEQEIGFIDDRLSRLNALDSLNKEQTEERNALEDEARVLKEQQFQREKQIATQKAKAEQRAAANQALINGFLAASKTLANLGIPAGIIPAAIAAAFGGVQAALIMSKNPVPQYFVGRKGGNAEWAVTQDRYGSEAISDKHGNIKTWGSDKGGQMTWLEKGDNVHTAKETKQMLAEIDNMPKLGNDIFHKIATKNVMPIMVQQNKLDYDKLADKIGEKFDRSFRKYDKISSFEDENGNIFRQEGGKIPVYIGRKKASAIIIKSGNNERN